MVDSPVEAYGIADIAISPVVHLKFSMCGALVQQHQQHLHVIVKIANIF